MELKKWLFDSSSYDGICIVPLIDVIFFLKLCHMRYQISNATSNISTCSYCWSNHLTILFSPLLGYLPCWSKGTYFTMASTFAWEWCSPTKVNFSSYNSTAFLTPQHHLMLLFVACTGNIKQLWWHACFLIL